MPMCVFTENLSVTSCIVANIINLDNFFLNKRNLGFLGQFSGRDKLSRYPGTSAALEESPKIAFLTIF